MDWSAVSTGASVASPIVLAVGAAAIWKIATKASAEQADARAKVEAAALAGDDRIRKIAIDQIQPAVDLAFSRLKAELPELLNTDSGYQRKPVCKVEHAAIRRELDEHRQEIRDLKHCAHESPCGASRATAEHVIELHGYAHKARHELANRIQRFIAERESEA